MESFNNTKLNENILQAINEMGFKKPTPIQAQTIPHLMFSKKDLIATAQTGTGKTGAFGLPSVHLTHIEEKQTQTLVLCPTRELCIQIAKDLKNFSKYMNDLNIVAVYGGASIDTQTKALRKGAHIVIGTPGRTKDLIRRKRLHLADIRRIILDEADEMLSMGFKEDMEAILASTPEKKQTILFSATMSKKIVSITKTYMQNPVEITASRVSLDAENVKHIYFMVHASDRYEVLKRIADMNPNIYGITFCRTRKETKEIANKLMHDGYNADAIHGDLSQAQRDEVMGKFRKRKLHMLVATDVAARGLDVNDLTHVINFNLPNDAEIYIHRSGRTGRAGKSGISIAIIHSRETRKIREIERIFKVSFSKEQVPSGKNICQKQLYTLIDKIKNVTVDQSQIEPFLPTIYEKLESLDREELIKHFVSIEFNRFLTYYKNAKDINYSSKPQKAKKNKREKRERQSRNERRKTPLTSFYINLGSKNKLTPSRLMGIINESLRSGDAMIGNIEIMKKFSFFELEESKKSLLLKNITGQNFEGEQILIEVANEKPITNKKDSYGDSNKKRGRGNRGKSNRKRPRSKNRDRKLRKNRN